MLAKITAALRLALPILAFITYAASVVALRQDKATVWDLEEEGPLAVALSHRVADAKFGRVDTGVTNFLRETRRQNIPARDAVIAAMTRPKIGVGAADISTDGNGVGIILISTLAFALFGLNPLSLTLFYLLLIGTSAVLFTLRFRDRRALAVPVVLLAMTWMLLTILTGDEARQIPLGGVRSYAMVAILPAIYWLFEIIEAPSEQASGRGRRGMLMAQIAILSAAISVRGSPIYLLAGVIISASLIARARGYRLSRLQWMTFLKPLVFAIVLIFVIPSAILPRYVADGRVYQHVWHRVLISLGVHPDWPFPGIRETYPCPEIPEGIVSGIVDRNGHCIWLSDASNRGKSAGEMNRGVYGGVYQTVMRAQLWDIARKYPHQVFEAMTYYKAQMLYAAGLISIRPDVNARNRAAVPFFFAQLAIFFTAVATTALAARRNFLRSDVPAVGVLALLSLGPPFIAWTSPHTIADLSVYAVCVVILCGVFCLNTAQAGIERWRAVSAKSK